MKIKKKSVRAQPVQTQIIMLGTGTPRPDPDRSGPATAIVANWHALSRRFRSRRHSPCGGSLPERYRSIRSGCRRDHHCLSHSPARRPHRGLSGPDPDALDPWSQKADQCVRTSRSSGHDQTCAGSVEDRYRQSHQRHRPAATRRLRVNVHEIAPGEIYSDRNIRISAFPVRHGALAHAFGFRLETSDKVIVISGDTAPTLELAKHCEGSMS